MDASHFFLNMFPSNDNHKLIVSCHENHPITTWWGQHNQQIEQLNHNAHEYNAQFFHERSLRYIPETDRAKHLLRKIFNAAWDNSNFSLGRTVYVVNRLEPKPTFLHMTLNKMFFIDCPRLIGNAFKYFVIFPLMYFTFRYFLILTHFYDNFISARVVPFLINHCPLKIIQIGTTIASRASLADATNYQTVCCIYMLTSFFRRAFPNVPYLSKIAEKFTLVNCIGLTASLSPGNSETSYIQARSSILLYAVFFSEVIQKIFSRVASYFIGVSIRNENRMNHELKQHLRTLWLDAMLVQR